MNPFGLTENRAVLDDVFVRSEKDLELSRSQFRLQFTTLSRIPFVRNHLHSWCPFRKLARPISHGRQGNDDKKWPTLFLHFDEEGDQRNCLNRLSETLQ